MSTKKAKKASAVKKPVAKPAAKKPVVKAVPKAAAKPARPAAGKPVLKAAVKTERKATIKPIAKKASGPALAVGPAPRSAARPSMAVKNGPKIKPLTKQQIEYFRKKLLVEKQRVLEEVGELTAGTFMKSISDEAGENSRYSYHLGDVASLSYGREFSMGLAERQQNYLQQVEDALQRIDEGTYGMCKVTGEPIAMERLEEVPVAKYSVRGKEIMEAQRRRSHEPRFPVADSGRIADSDSSSSDGDD